MRGAPANLLDVLLAAKDEFNLYAPVDTHWNGRGAFIAYKRLMAEVETRFAVNCLTDADIAYSSQEYEGDLGHKVDPPRTGHCTYAYALNKRSRLLADNCVERTGRILVMECDAAPPTTCVICGDSYAYSMLPFLAESFGRVVFAQLATLDHELVRNERAEVVISITNERFLIDPPRDEGLQTGSRAGCDEDGEGREFHA